MASIEHRGGNKYRLSFYHKGNRATRVIEAKSPKKARDIANALEVRFKETGSLDGVTRGEKQNKTVTDLAEEYMEYLINKPEPIAEKTRQKYKDIIENNIIPYFKGYKVSAIGSDTVEKFLQYLCKPEARVRKKYPEQTYSKGTISEIFKLFDAMMKKAEMWKYIEENPCDGVEKIKVESNDLVFYTDEQLVQLLNLIDEDTRIELARADEMDKRVNYSPFTVQKIRIAALSKQLIINLAIKTAARRGEILGLHRPDIDLQEKTITYQRQVLYTRTKDTYVKAGLKGGDTKLVYINESLAEMISNYFNELDKLFELSNGILEPNDLLFMTLRNNKKSKIGDVMFPDPVSEWFKLFLQMHNMPPITFHKLRTSSLSYLLNNGMDIFTTSKIAGHSNTATLEKHYAGVYNKSKALAASKFDKLDNMRGI